MPSYPSHRPGRAPSRSALAALALVLAAAFAVGHATPAEAGRFGKKPAVARVEAQRTAPRGEARPGSTRVGRVVAKIGGAADRTADRLVAASTKQRSAKVGRFLKKAGDGVRLFFGTDTLRSTSFEIGVAGTLSVPGLEKFGNLSLYSRTWSGSVAYYEDHVPQHGKDVHFNVGASVTTPVGGAGWDTLGKTHIRASAPYVSGTISKRGYTLQVGIPYFASLSTGEVGAPEPGQYDRGSFIRVNGKVGGFGVFGIGLGLSLYYKPFALLTKRLRPVAEKLDLAKMKLGARVGTALAPVRARVDAALAPVKAKIVAARAERAARKAARAPRVEPTPSAMPSALMRLSSTP